MMRFSEVEAFRAVMLSGSTTAAAQTLHTSQPNVSRAIALLEQKTGLKLFDRLPGRLVPTSDGRSFFKEVQRSFAGLHHLDEAAKRIKRFSGGALTVAAVQMLALGLVPRVMQQFCQNLPEVSVSIHTGHATTVARWVEDQTCDVGLVSQVNNNYGLAYEHLYELDAVCVMPPDHRLASKGAITPQDLANEPFISLPRTEHGYSQVDTHFENAGIDRHIRLETSYSSITCSLVMQGLGLSIVNPLASLDYRHAGMVTRPFLPTVKHQGYIIYSKERTNDRLISDFVATVKDVLACELSTLGCKAPA